MGKRAEPKGKAWALARVGIRGLARLLVAVAGGGWFTRSADMPVGHLTKRLDSCLRACEEIAQGRESFPRPLVPADAGTQPLPQIKAYGFGKDSTAASAE